MRPCSVSAEAERFTIVEALAEVNRRFPHRVDISFERYLAQTERIEEFLRETLGDQGLIHHPDDISTLSILPHARYIEFQKGAYSFEDKSFAAAVKLLFA